MKLLRVTVGDSLKNRIAKRFWETPYCLLFAIKKKQRYGKILA